MRYFIDKNLEFDITEDLDESILNTIYITNDDITEGTFNNQEFMPICESLRYYINAQLKEITNDYILYMI
jgi:hypothetical protein